MSLDRSLGRRLPASFMVAVLFGVVQAASADAQSAPAYCADLMPDPARTPARSLLTESDLIRLRDIGSPDSSLLYERSPLSISPDGRRVAFVISRADPATNSYCQGLVILAATQAGQPLLVDRGGAFIATAPAAIRGLMTPSGFPAVNVAKWSHDGRRLAYVKRVAGSTQAWIVESDGSGSRRVSDLASDVEDVAFTSDDRGVVLRSRPALAEAQAAIDRRADQGYRYDTSFVPGGANKPRVTAPIPDAFFRIDITTGDVSSASQADKMPLQSSSDTVAAPEGLDAVSATGAFAWSKTSMSGAHSVGVRMPSGRTYNCRTPACRNELVGIWWRPDSQEIWFETTEGWAGSDVAFYRWRPSEEGMPVRTILTPDAISGCEPTASGLVCLRDASRLPRHVVDVNPSTGETKDLFIANPEFEAFQVGAAKRILWTNRYGVHAFGDLVLPTNYRPGRRYPLIVVQYMNRGFLRGGTGDEFPIYLFSQRGYAVLAFNRVTSWSALKPRSHPLSPEQAERINTVDWMNRRNQASAVVAGIRKSIMMGITDPKRIGLTGLSDGSTTAQFLLVNTHMFAAASLAACCMEPTSAMIFGGEAWADQLRSLGYPGIAGSKSFWAPISFLTSAPKLKTPVMFNEADDEYPIALTSFEAVRSQGLSAEFYIYPDEHHIIWQPSHREAIYKRNLVWFERFIKPGPN